MSRPPAPPAQRVALLGFGDFERSALVSYLRLSGSRVPAYQEAPSLAAADYVIADADHAGTLDAVLGADRVADTVFIGSLAPDGALAWMMRPIDPLQVFRELDATVTLRMSQAQAPAAPPPASRRAGRTAAGGPPVADPAARRAGSASPSAPSATAEPSSPRRVGDVSAPTLALLVDGSEVALRLLERQLQALGLRTETVPNSQVALQMLAQRRYDVVFLDVDLGPNSELDGLALCQRVKRQHRSIAAGGAPLVVMVSALNSPTDRVRGNFAGCDAYLAKPLDDDVLRRSLRNLGLRLSAPSDGNSGPGNLLSRPLPLDRSS